MCLAPGSGSWAGRSTSPRWSLTWHNAGVTERWRAPGGWTVQVVRLTGTPGKTDGERLRVCQYGFWTADVRTVAELERYFRLADLEPDWLSMPA
jgi:hypothetical protein